MSIRTIVTANSIWTFELDEMKYIRTQREDGDGIEEIPYTEEWEPFLAIEPRVPQGSTGSAGGSSGTALQEPATVIIHRPVPFGTGALRQTSRILSDTHNLEAWPRD